MLLYNICYFISLLQHELIKISFHMSSWDISKTKKVKQRIRIFLLDMFTVVLKWVTKCWRQLWNIRNCNFTMSPTSITPFKARYSDLGHFMMVTDLRCWWQNHYVGDVLNQSPTSQFCHQHISSLKFVSNIDVALWTLSWYWFKYLEAARLKPTAVTDCIRPKNMILLGFRTFFDEKN